MEKDTGVEEDSEEKDVDGASMDLETFVQNSFVEVCYNDYDVSLAELFEIDDLFLF